MTVCPFTVPCCCTSPIRPSTGDRVIPHTKIIGHPWNARSLEVREFLARNRLYYTWFRADEKTPRLEQDG